ncbi:rhomboid family intramembrane serine protease [Eubacterium sp. MSJ-13]|uniref:rhomboid family intramembrane serine protease n=1 Tax=Eubacterium sp. MSJ-13 TaxID=2841513 RepID=UPI001C1238BB|nr:rhomboid family intramembrane serine protease [Eubacterium sp. MSJ-13]MBU5478566.1 rhomboid family intramembrane serine protease [Eubacterium sp. MSJ-13]
MEKEKKGIRISFNSPVILVFSIACLCVLGLGYVTGGVSDKLFFCVYRSSFTDPLTYFRFFGHVLGHANWEHFLGNIMMILVVGPLLEEKYGSADTLLVILVTAFVTGVIHFIFFPDVALMGASGVVFAFILLASMTSIEDGKIPLTFILVAVIYIGGQIHDGLFVHDNVSNLTHIIGGVVGSVLGIAMNKCRVSKY